MFRLLNLTSTIHFHLWITCVQVWFFSDQLGKAKLVRGIYNPWTQTTFHSNWVSPPSVMLKIQASLRLFIPAVNAEGNPIVLLVTAHIPNELKNGVYWWRHIMVRPVLVMKLVYGSSFLWKTGAKRGSEVASFYSQEPRTSPTSIHILFCIDAAFLPKELWYLLETIKSHFGQALFVSFIRGGLGKESKPSFPTGVLSTGHWRTAT